jgi:hypothetical protein
MDRYRTLCFAYWTGTGMFAFGSWQGTALPVPKGWNSLLATWERQVPLQGIGGSHQSEVRFPSWELEVTIASNCWFPDVGTDASQRGTKVTYGSQHGNQRLPLQGAACPERLELLVPNLGTKWVTLASKCRLPEDGTHASRPGNHRLPLQGIAFPRN